MRLILCWAIAAWIAVVVPAYADGASGTYVGQGSNSAFLMQIVETAGGQLTGRYEQTVLQPSGQLDQRNASVTGASDGHTIVLTIKWAQLLSGSITASGTLDRSFLHVSGSGDSGNVELNLAKSEEVAYRTQVASLSEQARAITAAQDQAKEIAHLKDISRALVAASAAAESDLPKFLSIEQKYRAVTDWMQGALAREQSIFGGGQASVARNQISVAINQAKVQGEQLHATVQTDGQNIRTKYDPFLKDTAGELRRCQTNAVQQNADQQSACAALIDAISKFKQSIEAFARAFDQAENVWIGELRKQAAIVQASELASR